MIFVRGKSCYYDFWIRGRRYGPKSLGPITKTQAKRIETELKAKIWRGEWPEDHPPVPTFGTYAVEFLTWYRTGRRPASIRTCGNILQQLARAWGTCPLDEITTLIIERYKRDLAATHKPQTVNNHLDVIKHLFRRAVKWGYLRQDPAAEVAYVRRDERVIRVLTAEEETRLLAACSPRVRPLVQVALLTGLRRGELEALTWEAIDWGRPAVTVESGLAKSRRSRRIPLTPTAVQVLRARQAIAAPGDPRVFGYRDCVCAIRAAAKRAHLPGVSCHTFRHTFATRCLERGVNIRTVQRWLGHASLTQTQRYTHPSEPYEQDAILVLEAPPPSPATDRRMGETSSFTGRP